MAMQEYDKELNKIRGILIGSAKGYTVTEIAKRIGINRNSVAKYLDILVTTGTVEMKNVGSAKLFTLSKRMPLTSIIDISSDYILLLDEESNVTYANENMLNFENSSLDEIIGKPVSSLELSRRSGSRIDRIVLESLGGKEISTDLEFRKGSDLLAFHAKFVPGLFENNKKGLIVVMSSIQHIVHGNGNGGKGGAGSSPGFSANGNGKQVHNGETATSERLFRDYVELAEEGIWATDETAKTTFLNKRMAEMLGYDVLEMIGLPFLSFVDESAQPLARKMMESNRHEKTVYKSSGFEFIKKDGTKVNTMLASTPFFNESGDFTGGLLIITDITARKKAEDALRKSETYYRTIIETSPNGIVIFDPTWQIRMANLQTARYLGYPDAQDLDGKNIFNFIAPDDIEKCQIHLKKTLEKKDSASIECKFIRRDSSGFCVDFAVSLLGEKPGGNDFFLGMMTDITERRKAEALVRKSEIKYRTLVEGLSSIVFTTDAHGKITYVSPVVERILGYLPEDLAGKHFYVLVSSDDRHVLGIKLKEAKCGGSLPFDAQLIDKSGNPHWVRIVAEPMKENDRLIGITGLIGDINDWKLAENALSQVSLKYKAVVEDQTDLICRFSPDFRISFVNPAFNRFFNKSEKEIIGSNLIDLVAPQFQDTLCMAIDQLTRESPAKTLELDFLSSIGNPFSYHVTARAIFNGVGQIAECQISCRDITELKSYFERSQKLLQEQQQIQVELQVQNDELRRLKSDAEISEKKYRDFYEMAPLGNLSLDIAGRIITINPSGAQLVGKPQDRPAGRLFLDFVCGKSQESFLQFLQAVFASDERQFCTVRMGSDDNDPRRVLIIGKGVAAHTGEPAQCRTIIVDITGYEG